MSNDRTTRRLFGTRRRPAPPVHREPPLAASGMGEQGFVLAQRTGGERALPQHGPWLFLPQQRLVRHLLVCGATGSGKTETLLRLAWTVARCSNASVWYLDGKGDTENAQRFAGLMTDAGRETRVFPNEPFDGWRGQPHEIHSRLMKIIDYADTGGATWYRDIAKTVLRLVCDQPDGPPRSSNELLARMNPQRLVKAHPDSSSINALTDDQVAQARLRYEAFFGQMRGQLDGNWAWDDANAAYILLDSLKLSEEVGGIARFLFEDVMHYISERKPREQLCLLIVDEFSSLSESADMAARVEKARGFNCSLVLAPQVVEGMGGHVETARILGSVDTVICHRVNTPDELVGLAGTRQRPTLTTRLAEDGLTRDRSIRLEERLTIDPNRIQALPPGAAYIISHGKATKAQILRAPNFSTQLPAPNQLDVTAPDEPRKPDTTTNGTAEPLPF